ncbi:MAG: AsnC family transcriptional regulator, partial [Candidatus Paceibacterota bacterium]
TNPRLSGYAHFKVYLQLQNTDVDIEQKILDYLKKHQNSFWVVSSRGRWDLMFSYHAQNVREFGEFLREFMDHFSEYILTRMVNMLECGIVFNRAYLWPGEKKVALEYGGKFKTIKLNPLDLKILDLLRQNSREKLVNISKRVGISPEAVRMRIKNMEKKQLIQGYKISLDLERIGYESYLIAFKFRNLDSKIWRDIVAFANMNEHILYLPKTIGSHDLDIEVEVKDSKELDEFINSFRSRFGKVLQGFESAQIIKEHKLEFYHPSKE